MPHLNSGTMVVPFPSFSIVASYVVFSSHARFSVLQVLRKLSQSLKVKKPPAVSSRIGCRTGAFVRDRNSSGMIFLCVVSILGVVCRLDDVVCFLLEEGGGDFFFLGVGFFFWGVGFFFFGGGEESSTGSCLIRTTADFVFAFFKEEDNDFLALVVFLTGVVFLGVVFLTGVVVVVFFLMGDFAVSE